MKKILLLLLAILTVAFAVTAQSLRYFTIQVNGSDEWTPFPGKTGVTFEVENEPNSKENIKNILSFSNDGKTIRFTGKQVGEASITATLGDQKTFAWVYVRGMEVDEQKTKINYHYNPPKDSRWWVDTKNGCCLQISKEDGSNIWFKVTDYNLDYTEWTNDVMPGKLK